MSVDLPVEIYNVGSTGLEHKLKLSYVTSSVTDHLMAIHAKANRLSHFLTW